MLYQISPVFLQMFHVSIKLIIIPEPNHETWFCSWFALGAITLEYEYCSRPHNPSVRCRLHRTPHTSFAAQTLQFSTGNTSLKSALKQLVEMRAVSPIQLHGVHSAPREGVQGPRPLGPVEKSPLECSSEGTWVSRGRGTSALFLQ